MSAYFTKADCTPSLSKRSSTALEYQQAGPSTNNAATKQIDAGLEPYLIDRQAYELGMHCYIEVHDTGNLIDGQVELFTARASVLVAPDTLLIWK